MPAQPEPPQEPGRDTYNYSIPVPKRDAVGKTYFNDFILYSGLANTTSYTSRGLMVNSVFTDRIINMNAVFFGGNHGELKMTSNKKNNTRLLVIKDSFANAFVQFAAEQF